MHEWFNHAGLWVAGAMIGLGQLLNSDQSLSVRAIVGRMVVSGGLGASAGLILLAFDNVPLGAQFGAAAALASAGTSVLEKLLMSYSDRFKR